VERLSSVTKKLYEESGMCIVVLGAIASGFRPARRTLIFVIDDAGHTSRNLLIWADKLRECMFWEERDFNAGQTTYYVMQLRGI
jgi:hypothetical protein